MKSRRSAYSTVLRLGRRANKIAPFCVKYFEAMDMINICKRIQTVAKKYLFLKSKVQLFILDLRLQPSFQTFFLNEH